MSRIFCTSIINWLSFSQVMGDGQVWKEQNTSSHIFLYQRLWGSGRSSIEYRPTKKMYSNVLTKPKQGKAFCKDRAILMNCDEDYDNIKEQEWTYPCLKDRVDALETVLMKKSESVKIPNKLTQYHRSVLGENRTRMVGMPTKQYNTSWSQGKNHVRGTDKKARMRHLKAIKTRIMQAWNRINIVRGREQKWTEWA